ncbi:hypothetical protein L1987_14676 [Smallanthus sonchifolius]|uniref:Uncharacterized protein n=1 Tax=Smallanthus sonchifolius TaxID=185202 RepID=A0ACB9J410_9ASTR|nr:hypothetical protein L1987_14676 [Smallanthus sonchifolius]
MMVSLFDTTQFHFNDSMLEDVITEVKKVEGQNNNKGVEIVDDVIKNVCKDISKQHTNEVVNNETTQGEGGEDGEKKEEKRNEKKPAQEEKTEKAQRVILKVADPVIAKPKQLENPGSLKKSGSRFDFARVVKGEKADKTFRSKPSVPASTGSILPGIQIAGNDEKPTKGKGREGNEEKPAQVKKVKEVDAGEGKVNEEKVAEDDAGKTAQVGGFETPTPKSKDDSEVPVHVKKVNEDDNGKTAEDGENKELKKKVARATRPAEALCSPYVQRVVQLNTKRENIEDNIAELIFASIEDPWIFVFQNATGRTIPRICMESFHPSEYLHVNAIIC